MLTLLALHSLRALVVHMDYLTAYVAEFVVGIIHRRYKVGVCGGTLRNSAQNDYIAAEITCGKIRHHESDSHHYVQNARGRRRSHLHGAVTRQNRAHHYPAVGAALRLGIKVIIAVGIAPALLISHRHRAGKFFRRKCYRAAVRFFQLPVDIYRYSYFLIQLACPVIARHEVEEALRVNILHVVRYYARVDKVELFAYFFFTKLGFIVKLEKAHADDYHPQGENQRQEHSPLIANFSP